MKKTIRRLKASRLFLWLVFLGIAITGIALLVLLPASEDDLPHPLSGILRQYHGAFSFLSLFMLGFFTSDHVAKKIRYYTWHPDGVVHLVLWLLLVVTGYFLYYPNDAVSELMHMSLLHWSFGLVLLVLFPIHVLRKKMLVWWKKNHQ